MHRALDDLMLARAPASPAQGLLRFGIWYYYATLSLISCMMFGLEQLGVVDKNSLERDLSALLLRALAVGR